MTPARLKKIRDNVLELGRGAWSPTSELAALLGVQFETARRWLAGERKIRSQVIMSLKILTLVKLFMSEAQWKNTIKKAMERDFSDL